MTHIDDTETHTDNTTEPHSDAFGEYLRMINESDPSTSDSEESEDSDESDDESNDSDDSGTEEDWSESEDDSDDDNDYDPDSENYDEYLHACQLIREELGQTDNKKIVEEKFKEFEKWLPSVELENYEFSADGTSELWGLYLVDQLYADPNDTSDEEDADGNLLRHKRAKERRVDIRFDRKILESS